MHKHFFHRLFIQSIYIAVADELSRGGWDPTDQLSRGGGWDPTDQLSRGGGWDPTEQLSRGGRWDPFRRFKPATFCSCPKPGTGFPTPHVATSLCLC